MPKRWLLSVLIWSMFACADNPLEKTAQQYDVSALERSWIASVADTVGPFFRRPVAMTPWKDSLVVVDMYGPSVLVLPWSLDGGREFGRSGPGPGELKSPQGLATVGDTLVVFDRSNRRLSWFDSQGHFLYSRSRMIMGVIPTFHPRPGGVVVAPTGMSSHYAVLDSPDGQTPYLQRPDEGKPSKESPITFNRIVAVDSGCAVVDVENAIVAFEVPGGETAAYPMPPDLRRKIDPRLDSLRAEDSAGERAILPISTAGEAPGGVLVWFPGQGNPAGAMVNRAGQWWPINISEDLEDFPGAPLALVLRGHKLALLYRDGLRIYTVRS